MSSLCRRAILPSSAAVVAVRLFGDVGRVLLDVGGVPADVVAVSLPSEAHLRLHCGSELISNISIHAF